MAKGDGRRSGEDKQTSVHHARVQHERLLHRVDGGGERGGTAHLRLIEIEEELGETREARNGAAGAADSKRSAGRSQGGAWRNGGLCTVAKRVSV